MQTTVEDWEPRQQSHRDQLKDCWILIQWIGERLTTDCLTIHPRYVICGIYIMDFVCYGIWAEKVLAETLFGKKGVPIPQTPLKHYEKLPFIWPFKQPIVLDWWNFLGGFLRPKARALNPIFFAYFRLIFGRFLLIKPQNQKPMLLMVSNLKIGIWPPHT